MHTKNNKLFCFFSGIAHRDIKLLEYKTDCEKGTILLLCENQGNHSLLPGDYIQLNGVLFEVIEASSVFFKASSTMELVKNTSMSRVRTGERLALGILAEKDLAHDCMWMLQPSALGQVTYKGYSVLEEHNHTLKLDFEATAEVAHLIKEDCHLGLAGSSLTARRVRNDFLVKFSIYCGRETREQSQFNQDLPLETRVNITEPSAIPSFLITQKIGPKPLLLE